MPENKHLRFFVILLYIALGIFILWVLFNYAIGWLAPFIIAFIISRLIEPLVSFSTKKLKIPRSISSGIFTLLSFGLIVFILDLLISQVVHEIALMVNRLPDSKVIIGETIHWINERMNNLIVLIPYDARKFIIASIGNAITNGLTIPKEMFSSIGSYASSAATSLPSILLFVIALLLSTYFFSKDYYKIADFIFKQMSPKWRTRFTQTKNHLYMTLINYIKAMFILLLLTFFELCIGFSILRIDYSIILAFFISLIDALPILGTGTILIPWAIISLLQNNFTLAIGLAVVYGVILIVRNLVEPKIVGEQIGLHPLLTLGSIYIGIQLFGLPGIFMPIFVVLLKKFNEWDYLKLWKK